MKNARIREENFFNVAYQFMQAAYKKISIDKEEFKQQIKNANTINYLAGVTSNSIVAKNYEGWIELQSILKEGLAMINNAEDADTYFDRGHKIMQLRIESEKYVICVEVNLMDYYDILLIKEREKVVA